MVYALKVLQHEIKRLREAIEYGNEIKMPVHHPQKLLNELEQAYNFLEKELNND